MNEHLSQLSHPNSSSASSMYRNSVEKPLSRGHSFASTDLGSSKGRRRSPVPTSVPYLVSDTALPLVHAPIKESHAMLRTLSVRAVSEDEIEKDGLTPREQSAARKGVSAFTTKHGDKVNDDDVKNYEKAFRLFDRDEGGYITCGELGRVMRSLGMDPTVDELHYMVSAADINGTGTVDFSEFVQMMNNYQENHHQEEDEDELIQRVFQVFDRSNDGFISTIELRTVMKNLGETLTEEELNSMLNCADTNGDGIVTFEEFRRICASGDLKKQK